MPGQQYNRQFLTTKVTCTKGTAKATPQINSWSLGNVLVYSLAIRVPNGHAGLTGIAVLYNGIAIFPWGQPVTYLVTTGETVKQDFELQEASAPLTIQTYNTDIFDHSFYLRADITQDLSAGGSGAGGSVSLVPIA